MCWCNFLTNMMSEYAIHSGQHCRLNICSGFGWLWQIQRRAGLSLIKHLFSFEILTKGIVCQMLSEITASDYFLELCTAAFLWRQHKKMICACSKLWRFQMCCHTGCIEKVIDGNSRRWCAGGSEVRGRGKRGLNRESFLQTNASPGHSHLLMASAWQSS